MIADPLVTIQHIVTRGQRERADGKPWCRSGVRTWCKHHGIDYLQLVRVGVPASVMAATDSLGALVAQDAIAEAGGQDG